MASEGGKRSWRRAARTLVLGYLAWCVLLCAGQRWFLFPGTGEPEQVPAGAQRLVIESDVPTRAYLSFPAAAGRSGPWPLVVVFHGNAESVLELEDIREGYLQRGWAVLTPEYRGYAGAAGSPSEASLAGDAEAFLALVLKRPEIDATRVIYHGRSLGGGVAGQLAARRAPAAMVLQSTFASVAGMSWRFGVPPWLVRDPFRTDRVLAGLDAPTLILHGESDEIIPVRHADALMAAAKRGTLVKLEGGHNDFPADEAAYWAAIDSWLAGNGLAIGHSAR